MSNKSRYTDKATLFDRLAVGILSAFLAAITYGFIWLIFALLFNVGMLPIELFIIFTGFMFLLSFFTLDNYVIKILTPLWNVIIRIFTG